MQKKGWNTSAVVKELNQQRNHTPEQPDFYFGPAGEVNQTREEQVRCIYAKTSNLFSLLGSCLHADGGVDR